MATSHNIVKQTTQNNKKLQKLTRKHLQEQQRRIKPGECIKYIRCIIDPQFLDSYFGSEILSELNKNNIKYKIQNQKISKIISWERSDQQTLIGFEDFVTVTEKFTPERQIINIITAKDFINDVKENNIRKTIKLINDEFPDAFLTIIIYGLKNLPSKAIKYEIEKTLAEIQIEYNCCHRHYDTPADISQAIVQFSKAISEIPFKKQEKEKLSDIDAFLLNDNKDCVSIEGKAGLSRLWQSHLTRLPLVTLEVAEAIMTEYPNPSKLFKAYANTTEEDGIDLLSELKIRRSFGPLNSSRKLGPELSRKIFTLYSSLDPNEVL